MNSLTDITITNIVNMATISSAKDRFETITNRKYQGLSLCIDGQITYTHKGKKYVSNKNNAIILPKGATYTLHGDKKGLFPLINFKTTEPISDTFTVIPLSNSDYFINEYNKIKSLFLFEKNRAKIMSKLYDMFDKMAAQSIPQSNILLPAIKHIEKNYNSPSLTNAFLSQKCGISEVYFRKLFTSLYKTTPKQYIIDIRINKAKQLLTDGGLKISAISDECGFSNPYHFCRTFKQKVGSTPTEYMKQNRIYEI